MKNILIIIIIIFYSGITYGCYFDTLVGIGQGNDKYENIDNMIKNWNSLYKNSLLKELIKIDLPSLENDGYNISNSGNFGKWNTPEEIDFYSVKAGNKFSLYFVDNKTDGYWNTYNIKNGGCKIPNLSHISFWNIYNTSPVPEPFTLISLIIGLSLLILYKKVKGNFFEFKKK